MRVRLNILANYFGGGWNALMGFIFVPLYIRYLGIEAYGLIGVFAVMQAWLVLLDSGITPALSREFARYDAGACTIEEIRALLRDVEVLYGGIVILVALGIYCVSPWLATDWIGPSKLPKGVLIQSLRIVGFVVALRLLVSLYRGAFVGLQRQVWLNGCSVAFSTLRGVGVVLVLAFLSPTVSAFFVFQGLCAVLEAMTLALKLRSILPDCRIALLRPIHLPPHFRAFAIGMLGVTFLSLLLMQVDKVLLSKSLSLAGFGYYMVASTSAAALYSLIMPVTNASYPRFTGLVASRDMPGLIDTYHKFAQLTAVAVIPAALVLSLFSPYVLLLWTRDARVTDNAWALVSVLALGNMLHGLMHTAYTLQLAYAWTRFSVITNAIAVLVLLPALWWAVRLDGAMGAAIIWLVLNLGYVLIATPLMHRRLLVTEMNHWYVADVLLPLLAVAGVCAVIRLVSPPANLHRPFLDLSVIAVAAIASIAAALIATPLGRREIRVLWRRQVVPH